MKKILLCTGEEKSFDKELTMFKSSENKILIEHVEMFKNDSFIHKIFRNLGALFVSSEINEKLKMDLSDYTALIIFEASVKNKYIKFIRKNNPNLKIIIYFRNQFTFSKKRNLNLKYLSKFNIEFWSYHIGDCQKYNFKYNNQFWNKNYIEKITSSNIKYDCVFLGRTKSRINEILNIYKLCQKHNLKNYIYLVPKTKYDFDKNIKDQYFDYLQYLDKISESKVVIDLVNYDNYGLTLRPIEAMFLSKKVITNYADIKNYDFYNKQNIFIIGQDNEKEIENFIRTPFVNINEKIVEKYEFDQWIENFFRKGEIK